MRRELSFQEYRRIDMGMFAILSVIFELIIVKISRSALFADQAFTVSLAGAICSILYMRWGAWGGLYAALFGFLTCFYSQGTVNQYMIYIAGNLLSLLCVPVLKVFGFEKVRTGSYSMLFPLLVLLLMQLGRALVAMLLGTDPETAFGFVTTDALSIVFTLVIVWIARRLDGIYENQKHYLLRVHEEEKEANK